MSDIEKARLQLVIELLKIIGAVGTLSASAFASMLFKGYFIWAIAAGFVAVVFLIIFLFLLSIALKIVRWKS